MSAASPFLSVVVCTRDRAPRLARALASLRDQTLPRDVFEVVVVDDGSRDATRETARAFEADLRLRYAFQRPAGLASARNHGIFAARGEVVVLLDDDAVADPALLAVHAAAHRRAADPKLAVVGRRALDPALAGDALARFAAEVGPLLGACEEPGGERGLDFRHLGAGRSSFWRATLVVHGVFDPTLRGGWQDVELALRLASRRRLRLVHEPRAVTVTAWAPGFDEACEAARAGGEMSVRVATRHPSDAVQRWAELAGAGERWRQIAPAFDVVVASARRLDLLARMRREAGFPLDPADAALVHRAYCAAFRAIRLKGLVDAAAAAGLDLPAAQGPADAAA